MARSAPPTLAGTETTPTNSKLKTRNFFSRQKRSLMTMNRQLRKIPPIHPDICPNGVLKNLQTSVVPAGILQLLLRGYKDRMQPQALACACTGWKPVPPKLFLMKMGSWENQGHHVQTCRVGTAHLHNCFNIHHVESMGQCLPAIFVPDTTVQTHIFVILREAKHLVF